MTVFVDRSGLYALFDQDDQNHGRAKQQLDDLLAREEDLVCTNYVLVDCVSFTTMHRSSIVTVFAFDRHFADQGFECIP